MKDSEKLSLLIGVEFDSLNDLVNSVDENFEDEVNIDFITSDKGKDLLEISDKGYSDDSRIYLGFEKNEGGKHIITSLH